MKKWIAMTIITLSITSVLPAQARNVKYMLPIPNALESESAKENLDGSVRLYFGPQAHGKANKAIAKVDTHARMPIEEGTDIASCNAAFVDAVKTLQRNAKDAGVNAVANIASYFKRGPVVSSATEFECHAGSYKTHVMLKGELVQINGK
jgi:hypothetical protein